MNIRIAKEIKGVSNKLIKYVLDLENNKIYMLLNLVASAESVEELAEAIAAGGQVNIAQDIDASTGFTVNTDTVITNNKVIKNNKLYIYEYDDEQKKINNKIELKIK